MKQIYQYVIKKCAQYLPENEGAVLDYGCGRGEIVEAGLSLGMEIYGVEEFYGGSNIRETVKGKGLLGHEIKELDKRGKIPFQDNFFDLVVSNQVFEHVKDLDFVINEITRVLKPNGKLLCLFPSKDTIREDHCGIAFTHWFSKESSLRYYWLLLYRKMGCGRAKGDKSPEQWSKDLQIWLNKYTYYRSMREIEHIFKSRFSDFRHIEDDYILFRLKKKGLHSLSFPLKIPLVKYFSRLFYRKLGGVVLIATKGLDF